jgi:Phasin protein
MTAQRARSKDTPDIPQFTGALTNGHSWQSMIPGAETLLATLANSQREMLDFASMRLEKDGDAIREVTACRNWTDALTVQSRWSQEMLRDYTAETTKLLALYTNAGGQESPKPGATS